MIKKLIFLILLSLLNCVYADLSGYYYYDPEHGDFFHAIFPPHHYPRRVDVIKGPYKDKFHHGAPKINPVTITVRQGSLRNNIIRILTPYHWHVIWKPPVDYHFFGFVTIRAPSLQSAMEQLLENYPLQATFYQGNRVVLIQSRVV